MRPINRSMVYALSKIRTTKIPCRTRKDPLVFLALGFRVTVDFQFLSGPDLFSEINPAAHISHVFPAGIRKELQLGFPVFPVLGLVTQPVNHLFGFSFSEMIIPGKT